MSSVATRSGGSSPRAHLLVIDDDNLQRMIVRQVAGKLGYETSGAATYEDAVELLGDRDYDCIILDISLGTRSGMDVLRLFEEVHCSTPIIIMSGAREAVARDVFEVGRDLGLNMLSVMPKPVDLDLLSDTLAAVAATAKPAARITLAGWTTDGKPGRTAA